MSSTPLRLIINHLMRTRTTLTALLLCIAAITTLQAAADANTKPNIICILCDDLGYGM